MRGRAAIGFLVAASGLVGCPVGCPDAKPSTAFLAGPERVPLRRSGPCAVQFEDGADELEYPRSDAGFYAVEINGLTEPPEAFTYDDRLRELTARPQWCPGDGGTIEVKRYRWVRTVHE